MHLIAAFLFLTTALAQEARSITPAEVERVRVALAVYYAECGYFPQKLEDTLESACGAERPTLRPTPPNKILTAKLVYKPLSYDSLRQGHQDYVVWMRVLWIPQASQAKPRPR